MSVAKLGFEVDSGSAVKAVADLDKLTETAGKTEAAVEKMGRASTASIQGIAAITQRLDATLAVMGRMETSIASIDRRMATWAQSSGPVVAANDKISRSTAAVTTSADQAARAIKEKTTAALADEVAQKRDAAAIDVATAAMQRQNTQAARWAERDRVRVAAGLNAWGNPVSQGEQAVAARMAPTAANTNVAAIIPPALVTQAEKATTALGNAGAAGAARQFAMGLVSIASPASLASMLIGGLVTIAIQYFTEFMDRGEKAAEILEKQNGLIDSVAKRWGEALPALKTYNDEIQRQKDMQDALEANRIAGQRQYDPAREAITMRTVDMADTISLLQGSGVDPAKIAELQDAYRELETRVGNSTATAKDARRVQDQLNDLLKTTSIPLLGQYGKQFGELAAQIDKANESNNKFLRDEERLRQMREASQRGPLIGSTVEDSRTDYIMQRDNELAVMRRNFQAQIAALSARSPSEREAAARGVEEARQIGGEDAAIREQRIALAGQRARMEAERQLSEAQKQRVRDLDRTLGQQELEISLIGRTAGEQARLRMEFERTQQLRDEASRNNVRADEREIGAIQEKAAEYGKLIDLQAKLNAMRDLEFERDQLFRSDLDARVADRLRSMNQPLDFSSDIAQMIRMNEILADQRGAWEDIRSTGKGAIADVVSSGVGGFKNINDVLKSTAANMAQMLAELAITNPLTNSIYGGNAPTLDSLGGLGGIFSALIGGEMPKPAGLGAAQAVSSMNVTAAMVSINGTAVGGEGGLGAITKLLNPANSNAATSPVTRAPLADVSPVDLLKFLGSGKAASHINGMSGGLQGALGQALSNAPGWVQQGTTINSGFRSVERQAELYAQAIQKYGSPEAARRWVAPPGNSQHNKGNAADLGFANDDVRQWWHQNAQDNGLKFPMKHEPWHIETQDARAGSASAALDKLTTSSTGAARGLQAAGKGLESFGGGLDGMGQALMNVGGGAGGGGWFSNLMKMFGGAGGATSWMMGISPLATTDIASGSWGAFAKGTEAAPPGWAWVGEEGPELMKMRGGETVRSNARSAQMVAEMRQGASRFLGSSQGNSGPVGKQVQFNQNIHNYAGVDIREERSEDEDSGIRSDVYIERRVAAAINRPGSAADKALAARGAKRKAVRR